MSPRPKAGRKSVVLDDRVGSWSGSSRRSGPASHAVAWLAVFFLSNFGRNKAGQCEVEGENQKICKGRHWKQNMPKWMCMTKLSQLLQRLSAFPKAFHQPTVHYFAMLAREGLSQVSISSGVQTYANLCQVARAEKISQFRFHKIQEITHRRTRGLVFCRHGSLCCSLQRAIFPAISQTFTKRIVEDSQFWRCQAP